MNCWICGATDAAARKHRAKSSDIKGSVATMSSTRHARRQS